MECVWSLTRYARYYTDFHKQAMDTSGKTSLFAFFTQSSRAAGTQHTQLVNTGVWSSILQHSRHILQLALRVSSDQECVLSVRLVTSFEDWELEAASQLAKSSMTQRTQSVILVPSAPRPAAHGGARKSCTFQRTLRPS